MGRCTKDCEIKTVFHKGHFHTLAVPFLGSTDSTFFKTESNSFGKLRQKYSFQEIDTNLGHSQRAGL